MEVCANDAQVLAAAETTLDIAADDANPDEASPDDAEQYWQSYLVDSDKVPESILTAIWCHSADPRHAAEMVKPLDRFPRLSLTTRDVEHLPAVHSIEHWRQLKIKKKAQRKAQLEAEHYASLDDMLNTLYGAPGPPTLNVRARQAQAKQDDVVKPEREVELEMLREAFPDQGYGSRSAYIGVHQKGRRCAFDEGLPWNRLVPNSPLAVREDQTIIEARAASEMTRILEAVEASDEDQKLEALKELHGASQRVREKCDRKVKRMGADFLRKQGQLSVRLTRRMKRLQTDYQEVHEMKVGTILPSVVHGEAVGTDVQRFLQRHRHKAERARRYHRDIHTQQVERFQGYVRLLSDPNRQPERGEIYLTECFRHVLSAGLIVDNEYFFRVLLNLEPEDFELAATVNMLAACCSSFEIDLTKYRNFLKDFDLPSFRPRSRADKVRNWEEWKAWQGVDLEKVSLTDPPVTSSEGADGFVEEDPFPFAPIVPDKAVQQDASEMASREDPLGDLLRKLNMDSVLHRYGGYSRKWAEVESSPAQGQQFEREASCDVSSVRPGEGIPTTSSLDTTLSPGGPAAVKTPTAPTTTTVASKPFRTRRHMAMAQKIRGAAEPMWAMANAPEKDRSRPAGQAPAMAPIIERPNLEQI
jgi:hypothetical protein